MEGCGVEGGGVGGGGVEGGGVRGLEVEGCGGGEAVEVERPRCRGATWPMEARVSLA